MHFLKKNWPVLILVLFVVSIVTWVLTAPSQKQSTNSADQKLRVVASFYPIAEFARHVGGDLVNVETITPIGADPIGAKLGIGERSWIMSHTVTLIEHDPHIWLNPVLAKQEVMWIYSALSYVDPTHDAIYKQNAEAYINQLSALDEAYAHGLKTCANRTVVTSHEAFAYLAKQYKFETIAITGLSPEEEPSAGRLAEIAKLAKEKQIKYIFFETLVSPKLAQTLASEIGAQTLVFDPIEGVSEEDQAAGKNYVSIMQENLTNLKIGMMCQ